MANRSNVRKAFTLIELLVVVFILAIIAAIAIPAVMQARESARQIQCSNNLKSIALAINAHLEQKIYYPREENSYSAFVLMLPFLDQTPLFNSFNFALPRNLAFGPNDVNYTAFTTTVSVFICPSDVVTNTKLGPTSYGGNLGTGAGSNGRPDNGPFASSLLDPKIRDALVRDGLANTVAVSEFCRTQGRATTRDQHAIYQLGSYTKSEFKSMLSDCSTTNPDEQTIAPIFRGFCWAFDGLTNTSYDHNLTPNSLSCSCKGMLAGVWTASSNHSNGVNCAHLDGHVSFIRSTISTTIWSSLGTINGSEIVPNSP